MQQLSVERKTRRHYFVIITSPKRRRGARVCVRIFDKFISFSESFKVMIFATLQLDMGMLGFFPPPYSYPNSLVNDTKILKIRLHYVESKKWWGERAAKIRSSEDSEAGCNSAEYL